jgi:hypothetical protein
LKLIFIHIPKTGGSSIAKALERNATGVWLKHGQLEKIEAPSSRWAMEYLAGHFTMYELRSWVEKNSLSLNNVKVFTLLRNPLEQLLSNLSYPFELRARRHPINEPWMQDMLTVNPDSGAEVRDLLKRHPWLLNLQWQFLVTGSYLEEAVSRIDHIGIYPDVLQTIRYCSSLLSGIRMDTNIHRNKTRLKSVMPSIFHDAQLKQLIMEQHSLDMELFQEASLRNLRKNGVDGGAGEQLRSAEEFYDSWVSKVSQHGSGLQTDAVIAA